MNKIMRIGNRLVGQEQPCFIIAEAGVNHNGDIELAKKLVDVAAEAGADAVKFQTFKTEHLVVRDAPKADYQIETTGSDESQFEMLKKLELSKSDHLTLIKYCKKKEILFLSTPFEEESVDFLEELKLPVIKIPSGEVTNLPFIKYTAEKDIPVIMSTGMSTIAEIDSAVKIFRETNNGNLILLHCVSSYPAPEEQTNLKAMITLKDTFKFPVGYSDHTSGIEIPIAAVAMGACVIEKHFTLDKSFSGPDHRASLEPGMLKLLVRSIRTVEKAMGDGIKKIAECEKRNKSLAQKSLVAKHFIKCGETVSETNVCCKRPGTGIPPCLSGKIYGSRVTRDISEGEILSFSSLEWNETE